MYQGARTEYKGTPQGVLEKIGDVQCYVTTPKIDYDPKKVLLLFTDMFGITLSNNQSEHISVLACGVLLVDDFAKCGYKTVAPDFLNGDEVPPYAMNNSVFSVKTWVQKHLEAVTRPPIDKVIAALKEQGVEKFAVTGYCFGAKYAMDVGSENIVDVVVIAHPSQVSVDTFTKYEAASKAPLCLEVSDVDDELSLEDQLIIDEKFANFTPGYQRDCWANMAHGFAPLEHTLDQYRHARPYRLESLNQRSSILGVLTAVSLSVFECEGGDEEILIEVGQILMHEYTDQRTPVTPFPNSFVSIFAYRFYAVGEPRRSVFQLVSIRRQPVVVLEVETDNDHLQGHSVFQLLFSPTLLWPRRISKSYEQNTLVPPKTRQTKEADVVR
ncbi:dienelactone hydrolase family-domain-containing protein [Melanogaster broomeanus]|nr:dienelactone hydrolase family-domain-containing protein [Melanogaster broomeanus]